MFAAALLLVATTTADAAIVAVRVEEATGLDAPTVAQLADGIAAAIVRVRGGDAVVDRQRGECARSPRCLQDVRERTGAGDVVALRAVGGATRMRVVAARLGAGGRVHGSVQVDFPSSFASWQGRLAGMSRTLYPEATPPQAEVAEGYSLSAAGWIGFGAAVVAAGVAAGLRVSSDAIREEIATVPMDPMIVEDRRSESLLHGGVSNVMFGVAAIGVTVGLVELVHMSD